MKVPRAASLLLFVVLLASGILIAGAFGAAAHEGSTSHDQATTDDEVVEIGAQDVAVTDLTVTIEDTHLTGTGLPAGSIDDASYTVEESVVTTDGFTVSYQGQTYRVGAITVTIDDVGIELRDVSTGEEADEG